MYINSLHNEGTSVSVILGHVVISLIKLHQEAPVIFHERI